MLVLYWYFKEKSAADVRQTNQGPDYIYQTGFALVISCYVLNSYMLVLYWYFKEKSAVDIRKRA